MYFSLLFSFSLSLSFLLSIQHSSTALPSLVARCDGKGGIMGEDQRAKRGAKDTEADLQRFQQCRQLLITTLGLKILFQISGSATMPRQLPSAAHNTIGEGGSAHTLKNMCYHHKGIVSFKRLTSLRHPSGSNRLLAGSYHRAFF